jgi:hypothetical protein
MYLRDDVALQKQRTQTNGGSYDKEKKDKRRDQQRTGRTENKNAEDRKAVHGVERDRESDEGARSFSERSFFKYPGWYQYPRQ